MTVAETRIEFVYTSQLTLMMLRSRNTEQPVAMLSIRSPLKTYSCFRCYYYHYRHVYLISLTSIRPVTIK